MRAVVMVCPRCGRINRWPSREEVRPCACGHAAAPLGQAAPLVECRYRGEELGRRRCDSCRGAVALKLFACRIHRQCTLATPLPEVACCATCLDRAPSGAPTRPLDQLVTIVVVSFERMRCLAALLRSIRAHYPQLRILVADQSSDATRQTAQAQWCRAHPQVAWLDLPYDCGLSAARNAAIRKVQTPYVWLMDDDFLVLPDSDLAATLSLFEEEPSLQLVCGQLYDLERSALSSWSAAVEITVRDGRKIVSVSAPGPWQRSRQQVPYRIIGRFLNSFVARTHALRQVPWREHLKIRGEHRVHVADMAWAGMRCAETTALLLAHQPSRRQSETVDYVQLRQRKEWYTEEGYQFTGDWNGSLMDRPPPPLMRPSRGIVILTPGRTGSRWLAKLLHAMGWRMPDMDPIYGEPRRAVAMMRSMLRGTPVSERALRAEVQQWPRPWCVKSPLFARTLERWLPAWIADAPLLLLSQREPQALEASWRRVGWDVQELPQWLARIEEVARYWPWEVRRVALEDLEEASVRQLDPEAVYAAES